GFHAAQADAVTNTANMKYDTVTRSMVYDRIAADGQRYFHAGVQLGTSYTKALFLRFDDLSATIGIFQNHDEGVRFFYTVGSNEIRAYHGSSSVRVGISGNDITLGKWYSLVVTYDEPSTTMKIYLDGVLKQTNTAVAAHPAIVNEAIGAQNLAGLRGFRGAMMYAAHSYSAMDQTAITALNTVSQNLVTPFVVQTPSEIPALFSWRNPRIDSSVTRDGGELISNEQDTFGSLDALQSDGSYKPLYVPASNYVQYGGGAGNQEFLEMGAVAFGSDDFSISIWGYSDVQTTFVQKWMNLSDGTTSSLVTIGTHNATPSIRCSVRDALGNVVTTSLNTLLTGKWYHVVMSVDRANNLIKYYVDGLLKVTVDISALTDVINMDGGSFVNLLGKETKADGTYSRAFQGRLGDDHIYKGRALTADDVTNIFNDGTADYSNP
ncbi:MAG: hypothetical protein JKY93_00905, partial [Gammaproteobacteria bacterium]|nr:hypothetical protein [Gammaproteobacteria bacterium]